MSDLQRLEADLRSAGARVGRRAFELLDDVVTTGRDEARALAPFGPHTPHYRSSITAEVRVSTRGITAEFGPDKDLPQGPLGNIFEFGTATNAPIPHVHPPGDKAINRTVEGLAELGGEIL